MEGYGSYGISIDPNFDATRLALLNQGIIIAWAHVRGGGENGEDWHLAGEKLTKENTISDFIACADYLIKQGYTSPGKLALRGTSAGGITIGGALTQRPDLFALAIVNVGVVNALRAEAEPNGAVNTPEFGTVKDPDGFKALYAMDAYQHVKDGTAYPTVLLITGANDPRVDPVELFKMTARLQAATSSKNPVLLRVDSDAGHGIGSSQEPARSHLRRPGLAAALDRGQGQVRHGVEVGFIVAAAVRRWPGCRDGLGPFSTRLRARLRNRCSRARESVVGKRKRCDESPTALRRRLRPPATHPRTSLPRERNNFPPRVRLNPSFRVKSKQIRL
ncbi:MAG: prolyl oligopeptidase family serine peptidase [Verrucomicrobiota bacterium]